MSALFTRQMLVDARACNEQVQEFDRLFPKGSVNVTVAKARKVARKFDWVWARRFLDDEGTAAYDAAIAQSEAAYEAAMAQAEAACDAAIAQSEAAYEAAMAQAEAACDAARAQAWAAYEAAMAQAEAACDAARAQAWASAYIATVARREAARVMA